MSGTSNWGPTTAASVVTSGGSFWKPKAPVVHC